MFDLDPAEGLNFDATIAAALELRDRLKELSLESFARVTGGKGSHVVVPLRAPKRAAAPGWPEAKQFAHLVRMMMKRDAPDRYTTTMAKQSRGGKIFLDYLRNDRDRRMVPQGPAWRAVRPGPSPAGWNPPTLPNENLPRDPWADFDAAGGDLRAAIIKATKD